MLARLERVEGIEIARTNWEGTRIACDLAPGTSRTVALARVVKSLAPVYETEEVERDERLECCSEIDAGEWMDHESCFKLSEHEAKLLAARRLKVFRKLAALTDDEAQLIGRELESGLRARFRRYHDEREILTDGNFGKFWYLERQRIVKLFPPKRAAELREAFADE